MSLKRLLWLAVLPMIFAACENEPDNINDIKEPKLELTSEATMEVTAEAGNYEIGYILENKKEGVELTAECVATWVTELVVAEKVTFSVEANEGEARETKITVKYDTQSFDVVVKQAAKPADEGGNEETPKEPVNLEATVFVGSYNGLDEELYPNTDNYQITLSDKGYDEEANYKAEGVYYVLDLFAPIYNGDYSDTMTLPAGEYKLNGGFKFESWTFSKLRSLYLTTDAEAKPVAETKFESGTLTVTHNSLTLKAVIAGVEHTVTYAGDLFVQNNTAAPEGDDTEDDGNKDEGGNADNPDEGGNTDNPDDGGNVDNPDDGGDNPDNPDNPDEGGNTENPDEGGNTDNPDEDGNTENPDEGGNTDNPDEGGNTDDGGDTPVESDVTTWEIVELAWGHMCNTCNDVTLKTRNNGDGNSSFSFNILASVTDNKLPDGTYSSTNGGIDLKHCRHMEQGRNQADDTTVTDAEVVIKNNSDGTSTITANWTIAGGYKHAATYTGSMPEYE